MLFVTFIYNVPILF